MTVTSDSQPIDVNSTPEDKLAYMRGLLATLQQLDANHDHRISTQELANDDVQKFIDYSQRTTRTGADPLKELRDNLSVILNPQEKAEHKENAGQYISSVLTSMGAYAPQDLRDALKTAMTLTAIPTDPHVQAEADQHAQFNKGLNKQLDEVTPAPLRNNPNIPEAANQIYAKVQAQRQAALEHTFGTMIDKMKENGSYTPEMETQMRKNLGLPPTQADAAKASQQQQEIVALGKQLAQFSPENIETVPNVQQLAAAVQAASTHKGNAR